MEMERRGEGTLHEEKYTEMTRMVENRIPEFES